jgi:hypothetical protein
MQARTAAHIEGGSDDRPTLQPRSPCTVSASCCPAVQLLPLNAAEAYCCAEDQNNVEPIAAGAVGGGCIASVVNHPRCSSNQSHKSSMLSNPELVMFKSTVLFNM